MREFLAQTHDLLLKGGAAVVGFFCGMTGGGSGLTLLLGAVMAAQYAASLAAALLHKGPRTPGAAAVEGLLKKALSLLVVGLCRLLDAFVNEGNAMFYAAAAWFYIGGEALSLLESLALCGVPVPRRLSTLLTGLARDAREAAPTPAQSSPDR
ncbi:MAG TPA: phage holin family protein [Candidatus Limiplasma stercoravium]|nr:phage holin family protein [Candidatus Limiplasma stercoravium]